MFGEYQTNDLAQKLCSLEESYRLKQISEEDYISSKVNINKFNQLFKILKLNFQFFDLVESVDTIE